MASVRSPSSSLFSAALLACALSLTTPSCSLAIQAPEPDRPRNEVPKCDTGKGLVAMDGLWGTLFGLSALGAFSADESGAGIALIGASAVFVASAVRGNNAANDCRGAYEEYNVSLMRQQRELVAQQPLGAPVSVPRPALKKKPLRPVYDPQLPPAVEPTPPEQPVAQEPVAPEYATPRPIVKPAQPAPTPAPPPAKKPPPKPPADPDEEDWANFWKEVP